MPLKRAFSTELAYVIFFMYLCTIVCSFSLNLQATKKQAFVNRASFERFKSMVSVSKINGLRMTLNKFAELIKSKSE
jgi:hypothetical protein